MKIEIDKDFVKSLLLAELDNIIDYYKLKDSFVLQTSNLVLSISNNLLRQVILKIKEQE